MSARRTSGLALITVLWLLSLLAALATSMLAITRNNARMALRSTQLISANAAADSAIRLALLQIHTPPYAHQPAGFASNWQLRLLDCEIEVRVEREAGRLDLNSTDIESLLAAVFTAGGFDGAAARTLAQRSIAWRSAHGPFESVAGLREVLGLAEMAPAIADAFTVYSTRSPTIIREHAHPLVGSALDLLSGPQPVPQRTADPTWVPAFGQAFRVRACASRNGVATCRTAIARLTGRRRPFLIHAWYTSSGRGEQ